MSNTNDISVIKILYNSKLRLLLLILAVGVATAIITLFFPNSYSSTAAINVQKPEVQFTGERSPLNVQTLRALVESTWVKWELFEGLKKQGTIEDEMTFSQFQRKLSTRVENDTSRERNLIPMVKLRAVTRDQELSMVIANSWAEVVLKQAKNIYRTGVDELGTFTTNIYEKVSNSLLESEEKYTQILLESDLSVNKIHLEHNEQLYSQISLEVLKLGEEVTTRTALLKKLKEHLREQEIDYIWVGELFSREYSDDNEYVLPVTTALSDRITRTIRSMDKGERVLADFDEATRVDYKWVMLDIKKRQIESISLAIMEARTELYSLEPTYAKLSEELSKIDEKIVLSKAIGDDLLWEVKMKEDGMENRELPALKTESSNPVYQETKKEMVTLSANIYGLKNKIKEGKLELETLRKEVSDLNRELVPLSAKRGVLNTAIKKDRDLMTYFEKTYNEDRQAYESGEKELDDLKVKLSVKSTELSRIRKDISELEKLVFFRQNEISRQKGDVDNLTKIRASLAAKAAEVALLKVSLENISRSGIVLLYKAQADPIKVGPPRSRIVLVAMSLAFLLFSGLLILNEVVKEK
jgi:capsular polysaccharide biosynthesis protein/predicted  nucleic acid-binding Zn-ribbon protein